MGNYKICSALLLAVYLSTQLAASISVLGPRIVRPHRTYRVAVVPGSRRASLVVGVEGRRSTGQLFAQSREIQIQPGSSRIVDLEIGDPGPGAYELVARATSGVQFASSAPLVYQNRSFCVFLQTDKRVYQPSDTIQFRVVALDKLLLPLEGEVEVSVLDSGGAPVRQWPGASLDRGLFTAHLALADQPALGEWTLQASIQGQTYERQVLVADYILPKFNIQLDLPKQVLFSDGSFTANITATHYNGLPVNGELTLAAFPIFFSDVIQPVFSSPVRKVVRIDGKTSVTFSIKDDLSIAEDAARPVVVEAILEEEGTLRRQNVSSRTLLVRTPYRLKVFAPDHFKPNLPYKIQLEVVDTSGALMPTDGTVSVRRVWDDGAAPDTADLQLARGRALYRYTPDSAHINSTLNFFITYKEVVERVTNIRSTYTPGGQYLGLELITNGPKVGADIHTRVTSTEDMDRLNYLLIARGDIVVAKTMELSPARRTAELHVEAKAAAAPGAVLLVWYPRLDGEVVAASLYIPVEGLLQNDVQLLVSPKHGRPGGAAEVTVSAAPGSHAALLAGDLATATAQLASLDGQGSGITFQQVEREVESFSGLSVSVFKNDVRQPALGTDIGDSNAADTFMKSGVVILTDGLVTNFNPTDKDLPTLEVETGTRPPLAGPYAFSYLPPPLAPRYYLPHPVQPTWFLANLTTGPEGRGSLSRRTPMTPAEWSVGAFAVHPTLGLGLAAPARVVSDTLLSVAADLPATLQRRETVAVVVTLASALSADISVEVTFHNSEQYFEFEPIDNSVESVKKIELYQRRRVSVPAHGTATTAFLVTAARAGPAPVLVQASGDGISASLYRNIDVLDGDESELSTWRLLDARAGAARANLTLRAPLGTRLGPASLRVAGDLLAPALHSLKTLTAVGADAQQAIHPLVVGCILLDYLQATKQDDVGISAEARTLIESGNQRVLAYRLPDGSFAADLDSDQGDVWMTSLATRWLSRSARHLPVSPLVAQEAAKWLASAQQPDGSWKAPDQFSLYNPHAQRTLPLTAFSLLALLDSQGADLFHRNAINKAKDYLARHVDQAPDAYTLALLARSFGETRHPSLEVSLALLDLHSNATANERWWTRPLPASERRNPWLAGNSVDISTAAWGLQALLEANHMEDATKVARWLLATPDTLDADKLEALSTFAIRTRTANKLRVSVKMDGSEEMRQFSLDDDNALIIQTQLVKSSYNASVMTEGRGVGAVGLAATGSTNVTAAWPRYTLDPRVDAVSTSKHLQLSVCAGFVATANETRSGMTLMDVKLPSGFLADTDTITELMSASHVISAQLAEGGTRILTWLRPFDSRERCATLTSARAIRVARQRPGWVTMTDCYDSSHRARVFFSPVPSHLCNICQDLPACDKVCGANLGLRDQPSTGGAITSPTSGAHRLTLPHTALLVFITAVFTSCNFSS